MDNVTKIKAAVSTVLAVMTALLGWMGWLVVAWVAAMALDYLTGTAAAVREGEWSSEQARDGLWHKLGAVVAVLVSAMLDLTIGHILGGIPGLAELPVDYSVFLCPLVLMWYIITEAGSILENAGKLGAEYPAWLTQAIKSLRKKVDQQGDKQHPPDGE